MTLAEWLAQQYGPGRRFRSARELGLAAGLNQNTVSWVIAKNRGEPETLIQLAHALDVPVVDLFVLAGWLRRDDVGDEAEAAFLRGLRCLTAKQRAAVWAVVEAMRD